MQLNQQQDPGIDPSLLSLTSTQLNVLEARRSPAFLGNWLTGGFYKNPKHIVYLSDLIAEKLEKGNARIIICAAPRHGKSELIDVQVPTWYLWNDPRRRIILAGHSATFAATWGRKVRDQICENYKLLGVRIVGGFDAAMDEWRTDKGGGMRCAGVGVGITGLGADLFIIDDPTKDSKDASSSVHQNDLKDWFQGVVDRRLEPDASIIVTMQRWPGSDFVSWLTQMRDQGRSDWLIINLAALYCDQDPLGGPGPAKFWIDPLGRDPLANGGKGQALWPERWDEDALIAKAQVSEDSAFWHSQYQQRPPDGSGIGLAYHKFSNHNVKPLVYNPRLPILWALDFNVDPMTSLICQCEEDFQRASFDYLTLERRDEQLRKTINILDEIYLPNSDTNAACAEFIKRMERYDNRRGTGKLDILVYGDASGYHKKTTGKTDYKIIAEELRHAGRFNTVIRAIHNNPGQRDRVTTVNHVLCDVQGNRHLFFDPQCLETRRDLVSMKWHRTANGAATNDLDDSDPRRGHISDALGYLVWALLKLKGKVGQRSERLL